MTNSHILFHQFEYLEPRSVEEALAQLTRHGSAAHVLAGGTDLLVQMKLEQVRPGCLVNISKIAELSGITPTADGLRIGGLTTIRAIRNHPLVRDEYPALAEACAAFSAAQIQVMGTVGGNLCHGSPAADTAPALIALGAEVELRGPAGERRLPVEDFFVGPGQTARRPDELLTAVRLPAPAPNSFSAFLKISRVAADIAKASVAIWLARDRERIVDCRVAFGALAARPLRGRRTEAELIGRLFTDDLLARAADVASEEVSPISDVRSNAWYRRQITAALVHDGLARVWEGGGMRMADGGWRMADGVSSGASPAADEGTYMGTEPQGDIADDASHSTFDVPRSTFDVPRSTFDVPRSTFDVPRSTFDVPRSTFDVPRSTFDVSRLTFDVSRLTFDASRFTPITLTVNGTPYHLTVAANELLLNVLRDRLELTGAKYGCGIGECAACTVLMDGRPMLACLVLAVAANGSRIVTIEGLRQPTGELDQLQTAFIQHAAVQCGFCTPGMILTAKSLLAENPTPSEADVRDCLKGNLCRCTGYASIVRAVLAANA
ncbi:MAG: 2Fe-2S iron-sulfur cluster binding domain-containing protein [Chloroflexi bacterium]|nr:2Fe-2S iron-sulfur cluster binding domain-containing protein [Chloroflexota bacterium]